MYPKSKLILYLTYTDIKKDQLDTPSAFVWRYLKVKEKIHASGRSFINYLHKPYFFIVIDLIILTNNLENC